MPFLLEMKTEGSHQFFSIDDLKHVSECNWGLSILVQATEGDGSLPWDMFSHVFEFVQHGNRAFRENNFEEVKIFASCCQSLYSWGKYNIYLQSMHESIKFHI